MADQNSGGKFDGLYKFLEAAKTSLLPIKDDEECFVKAVAALKPDEQEMRKLMVVVANNEDKISTLLFEEQELLFAGQAWLDRQEEIRARLHGMRIKQQSSAQSQPDVGEEGGMFRNKRKVLDVEAGPRIKFSSEDVPVEDQCSGKAVSANKKIVVAEAKVGENCASEEQSKVKKIFALGTVCWNFSALIADFVLDGMLFTKLTGINCLDFPSPMEGNVTKLDEVPIVLYITIAKMPVDALAFLDRLWSLRKAMAGGGGILAVAYRQSLREQNKLEARNCDNALNMLFIYILLITIADFFKSFFILTGAGRIPLTTLVVASASFGMITAVINVIWAITWARFVTNPKKRIAMYICMVVVTTCAIGLAVISPIYNRYGGNYATYYHVRPIMDVVVCVHDTVDMGAPSLLDDNSFLPLTVAKPASVSFPLIQIGNNTSIFSEPSVIVPRACGNSSVIIPARDSRWYSNEFTCQESESYPKSCGGYGFSTPVHWHVVVEGRLLPWAIVSRFENVTFALANATHGVLTVNGMICPTWATYTKANPTFDPTVPSSLTAEGLSSYWMQGLSVRNFGLRVLYNNTFKLCGREVKLPDPSNQMFLSLTNSNWLSDPANTTIQPSNMVTCGPPWPCFMHYKKVATDSISTTNPLVVSAGPNDPGALDPNMNMLQQFLRPGARYVEWRMEILDAYTCG